MKLECKHTEITTDILHFEVTADILCYLLPGIIKLKSWNTNAKLHEFKLVGQAGLQMSVTVKSGLFPCTMQQIFHHLQSNETCFFDII